MRFEMIYVGATPAYATLLDNEDTFETSGQSSCISIIVMWGRRPKAPSEYLNVRARHAQGGVNDPRIFDGVPNERDTQVVIVPGYLYDNPDRKQRERDRLVKEATDWGWGSVKYYRAPSCDAFSIDRHAKVTVLVTGPIGPSSSAGSSSSSGIR